MDEKKDQGFGCARCWPPSPDAAWSFRRSLACKADLLDESHFHVMLLACPACSQRFVSVFTETIDWADGEDPQYWTVLPITAAEAALLARLRGTLTETELNALSPARRSLRRDHPKGAAPRCFWGAGISVRWHD